MQHSEIKTRLSAIVKAMCAKGMREPSAKFSVNADGQDYVYLTHKDPNATGLFKDKSELIKGDNPSEILANADAWISEQMTADERKKADFLNALSKAVELGREANVDVELTDALLAAMKKLSENAITDQRAV